MLQYMCEGNKDKGDLHMKITDVRVRILSTNNRLKGVASITIDDAFAVHELRIIEGREGLFVAMPSRKVSDGEFRDVAHPINFETRANIEKIIIDAYNHAEIEE